MLTDLQVGPSKDPLGLMAVAVAGAPERMDLTARWSAGQRADPPAWVPCPVVLPIVAG